PDVDWLDRLTRRNCDFAPARRPERDVTGSRLAPSDVVPPRHGFQVLDAPVPRIGAHPHQRLVGACHKSPAAPSEIVLYVVLRNTWQRNGLLQPDCRSAMLRHVLKNGAVPWNCRPSVISVFAPAISTTGRALPPGCSASRWSRNRNRASP